MGYNTIQAKNLSKASVGRSSLGASDLESQIAETESRIQDIRQDIHQANNDFREATVEMLSEWYRSEAERIMLFENPEQAVDLGLASMKEIRDSLERTISDTLPRLVYERIGLTQHSPSDVNFELRQSTKPLGGLLERYKFLSVYSVGNRHYNWTRQVSDDAPLYADDFEWSNGMNRAKDRYLASQGRLSGQEQKLADLRHRKAEEDARRLWGEAQD